MSHLLRQFNEEEMPSARRRYGTPAGIAGLSPIEASLPYDEASWPVLFQAA